MKAWIERPACTTADNLPPENKHDWVEMTRIGDLPDRTWVCGRCGKWRVMKHAEDQTDD